MRTRWCCFFLLFLLAGLAGVALSREMDERRDEEEEEEEWEGWVVRQWRWEVWKSVACSSGPRDIKCLPT